MSSVKSLDRAFKVDRAINNASKNFVIIRFVDRGYSDSGKVTDWVAYYSRILSFFSDIYEVEKKDVPEHVARYSLSDPDTILFFYKGSAVYRLSTSEILTTMNSKDFFDTTFEIMSKVLQPRR
ncbi:uncharacterized protein LOC113751665 [Coffea eugenioides]|uniref:Uncharacterized protein n=1 Tax=Coffea arabica TaxID=13443 RepID=A0A6P6UIC3_COFAR|nr:uncharacterized protein LOC113711064 [Coffea arabica]XP_027102231.1 uncharacterized protein LOC113723258 [Coffea arabica]XP_027148356.1 uncharacterized protein LOC113748949 [Coffea eugenioides]XP_027151556.1 uncharacterized protein LOC113751665 [Coffea eugenioides]